LKRKLRLSKIFDFISNSQNYPVLGKHP